MQNITVVVHKLSHNFAYAFTTGRRQCSSKRASDRGGKGKGGEAKEDATRGGSRGSKDASKKPGSAVTPIPQVTIGLAGPPGGAFNLAKSTNQEFILPKSVSKFVADPCNASCLWRASWINPAIIPQLFL